jgi:hypothetical protein
VTAGQQCLLVRSLTAVEAVRTALDAAHAATNNARHGEQATSRSEVALGALHTVSKLPQPPFGKAQCAQARGTDIRMMNKVAGNVLDKISMLYSNCCNAQQRGRAQQHSLNRWFQLKKAVFQHHHCAPMLLRFMPQRDCHKV